MSAFFSLAILEAVVRKLPDSQRILFVPSQIPWVGYQLAPGTLAKYGPYEYGINSWGFHYPEIPKEKPAGDFRIFALGDSIIFGQNTGKGDVSAALEERLNQKPPKTGFERWRVVNTGVLSYSTCQELSYLNGFIEGFKPDLVLVGYAANDPEGPRVPFGMDIARGSIPPWWRAYHWVKGHWTLLRYAVQKISPLITRLRGHKYYGPPIDKAQEVRYTAALHDPQGKYWPKCAECIAGFGEYQKKTGVRALFVIFPLMNHLQAPELAAAYARVEQAARAAGVAAINLYPYFKKLSPADLERYKGDGMHPSEEGHRFISGIIYDYMSKRPEFFKPSR